MTGPGFTPPYNLEAEQAVLGSILIKPDVLDLIVTLRPADFYREGHGKIFRAILGLWNQGEPVDLQTVTMRLKDVGYLEDVGGAVFMMGLTDNIGTAVHAPHYAKVVHNKAVLRRLITTCQEIVGGAQEPIEDVEQYLDGAENKIFQVMAAQEVLAQPLSEIVPPELERIEALHKRKIKTLGLSTGYDDMDSLTGGFQDSDLIIIAARPSMGKTALALNIATHAGKAGVPGAFFSLEMSKEQLVQRLVSSVGHINATRLRDGKLTGEEWGDFFEAGADVKEMPIYVVDKPMLSPLEIRSQARRLKAKFGIRWVVVDYLQLVHDSKARSREQEVAGISASLKALAKELKIPVIALSQLNRKVEERTDRRPVLSDLRESGAIEQDADLIFFIYRDEVYMKENPRPYAEVRLAKQRNGPTGLVRLAWIPDTMRFESYSGEE